MPALRHYRKSYRSSKILYEEFVNKKDGLLYIDILAPVFSVTDSNSDVFSFDNTGVTRRKVIGYVQMGLTKEGFHKKIQKILISTVIFTIICAFTGVGVTLFLTRRITSPIRALNMATQKISEGILDQHIEVKSYDEISDLAYAFNHMLERLRVSRSQVEERTNELVHANEKMSKEIAERKRAEYLLELKTKELSRSNSELEQFSYIVSHDSQEPLRKVMAFGDRLAAKFGKTLGNEGMDYIERMKSASQRMKTLIMDLLMYSRVSTKAQPFMQVDLSKVVQEVLSDLEVKIEQTGGCVKVGDLPIIDADSLQMRQLFQNLIGNALKFYRKEEFPVMEVQACILDNQEKGFNGNYHNKMCQITIEDNGIGFDEKYAERIFAAAAPCSAELPVRTNILSTCFTNSSRIRLVFSSGLK